MKVSRLQHVRSVLNLQHAAADARLWDFVGQTPDGLSALRLGKPSEASCQSGASSNSQLPPPKQSQGHSQAEGEGLAAGRGLGLGVGAAGGGLAGAGAGLWPVPFTASSHLPKNSVARRPRSDTSLLNSARRLVRHLSENCTQLWAEGRLGLVPGAGSRPGGSAHELVGCCGICRQIGMHACMASAAPKKAPPVQTALRSPGHRTLAGLCCSASGRPAATGTG